MTDRNPCILIVDDNPEIREIINVLLSGEGYLVKEAADGTEALRLLEEYRFDLIILDIMMPGMNGYETCIKIRDRSNAPILFLSARTTDSDKLLVTHRRQIFSASRLYETIWKEPYYYGANNTVMVHIRNLRQKIEEDPKNPVLIKTSWGKGYHCD
ncbi:MAG: response regulator transcription factor [Eubacteriales bacterium]|nr:response regulator transcription factor [Eubacteriales bacterium]